MIKWFRHRPGKHPPAPKPLPGPKIKLLFIYNNLLDNLLIMLYNTKTSENGDLTWLALLMQTLHLQDMNLNSR